MTTLSPDCRAWAITVAKFAARLLASWMTSPAAEPGLKSATESLPNPASKTNRSSPRRGQPVVACCAAQDVVPIAAGQRVVPVAAGDPVVDFVPGQSQVDAVAVGEKDLDALSGPQAERRLRVDGVASLARVLDDGVGAAVDTEPVVADATEQTVVAGPTVEQIVAGVAVYDVHASGAGHHIVPAKGVPCHVRSAQDDDVTFHGERRGAVVADRDRFAGR
jgi:hypothetical protein